MCSTNCITTVKNSVDTQLEATSNDEEVMRRPGTSLLLKARSSGAAFQLIADDSFGLLMACRDDYSNKEG